MKEEPLQISQRLKKVYGKAAISHSSN